MHSTLRPMRGVVARRNGRALLSSFRDSAVRAVAGKLRADLETNPNLWLGAAAVVS
jgi:hypothetical protein